MTIGRGRRSVGLLAMTAALVLAATLLPATGATAVQTYPPAYFGMALPGTSSSDRCWSTSIREARSPYRYVAAEWDVATHPGDRSGMLRARSASIGPWESFIACRHAGTGAYYFGTKHGHNLSPRLVASEQGYTGDIAGMLNARATALGPWELFFAQQQSDGTWALRAFEDHDGTPFVSVERAYPGNDVNMLRARAALVGPWERFFIPGMGSF